MAVSSTVWLFRWAIPLLVPRRYRVNSGGSSSGAVAVLEVQTSADEGSPLHVHHVENEWFYVFEGEYEIKVGNEIFHLKAEGSIYAPKQIPHAFHDVGETGGKMLVVVQPAGHIESFSVDLFKLVTSGTRDEIALKVPFQKHEMEIVGPPLPKKCQPMTTR
jgi:mannose-6-phosphate isomerase-like protein (cupin superfamily)